MDEDNNDIPRVTRARTRRLSALDTDSRPSTPLIDATLERASPRPTRRTRLNSATIDLRTPTRATRAAVARGETPEPITPSVPLSATKRTARTPAKSVRKQLPLKEEVEAEAEVEQGEVEVAAEATKVVEDASDVTRNTSANSIDLMLTPNITPTDSRRVTRSMSKTPPVPQVSMLSNLPQPQFDINNSLEEKQTETPKQTSVPTPVVEQQQQQQLSQSLSEKDASVAAASNNKSVKLQVKVRNISLETLDSPVESKTPEINKKLEETKETVAEEDTEVAVPTGEEESPKLQTEHQTPMSIEEVKSLKTTQNKADEDVVQESPKIKTEQETPVSTPEFNAKTAETALSTPDLEPRTAEEAAELRKDAVPEDKDRDTSMESCSDSPTEYGTPKSVQEEKTTKTINNNNNEEEVVDKTDHKVVEEAAETTLEDVAMEEDEEQPQPDRKSIIKIIADERLPDLTPDTKTRLIEEEKKVEDQDAKRKVDFQNHDKAELAEKPKYPKTPARLGTPPVNMFTLKTEQLLNFSAESSETPKKLMLLKKRNSSTPLAKPAEVPEDAAASATNAPPMQIDVIKSLADLESSSAAAPVPAPAPAPVQLSEQKQPRRLVSEDEDEDEEEEQQEDYAACEYFDNEVEVVEDYQSGDSMDSSERRELKENEIPHDGESVGSQDTIEDHSEEDEVGSLNSFIVSDQDEASKSDEEDDNDDEDDDLEELCFSSAEESVESDTKSSKKRRRIIVHDSSDDEEVQVDSVKEESKQEDSEGKKESKKEESINQLQPSKEKARNDDDAEVQEVPSSSEEDEATEATNKLGNKSIYEVPDSSDEADEEQDVAEKSVSVLPADTPTPTPMEETAEKGETMPVASAESNAKPKHNEEESALLAGLSSFDLTHLQRMFNPLLKSRRQTLYGPQMSNEAEPKPKMKRRSEQLNSDVQPSQSFIETLAKEKSQRLKRKHISKSFCGTLDDLDSSVLEEMQSKKAKKSSDDAEVAVEAEKVEIATREEPLKAEEGAVEAKKPAEDPAKNADFYLNYCDSLLQRANDAALEQKKQRIALGRKPKRVITKSLNDAVELPTKVEQLQADNKSKAGKLKKGVKRLEATKQALKHAMQLLVPDSAIKQPQSLARKLSPQLPPPAKIKEKVKTQKSKIPKPVAQVSPVKSSDEENHHRHQRDQRDHAMERIKTSAGYVVVSKVDKDDPIELIKTRSGIMKVEPATPTRKYFKEVPFTRHSRSGLTEASRSSFKKKPTAAAETHSNFTRNSATESALRFKKQIFGSSSK